MRYKYLIIVPFLWIGISNGFSQSQNTDSLSNSISKNKLKNTAKNETLDTKESLSYLGSKLMFQVKKRMNLTTEAEENAEERKNKKVALSFLGIKIEN